MIKTPAFWQSPSWQSKALRPLACVYDLLRRLKKSTIRPYKVSVPVICVGNLTVGGAGKTPTVIALVAILRQLGYTPHILSRGYKGSLKGPVCVDPTHHTFQQVGDEPLLLAQHAPTWVSKDRVSSAQKAVSAGATVLLLDDGFQNQSLYKDISFIVIDSIFGFGNGALFPAGPLREPIEEGLNRAQAVILMGDHEIPSLKAYSLPFLRAHFEPSGEVSPCPVVGFAGLAHPEKFEKTLMEQGYDVKAFIPFPDHHPFSQRDLEQLKKISEKYQASLITTIKDSVRLPKKFSQKILFFPIHLVFQNEKNVKKILTERLKKTFP